MMSLEKWIKPQKDKDESKKKLKDKKEDSKSKKSQSHIATEKKTEEATKGVPKKRFSKFILVCSKKSCGYQKTLMKQQLKDRDKICPKCKGNMKVKEI